MTEQHTEASSVSGPAIGPLTMLVLVGLLAVGGRRWHCDSRGDGAATSAQLRIERVARPDGVLELVAYASGGEIETGDEMRLRCDDVRGRAVVEMDAALDDDGGALAPHLHRELPPAAFGRISVCRGSTGASRLTARPSPRFAAAE